MAAGLADYMTDEELDLLVDWLSEKIIIHRNKQRRKRTSHRVGFLFFNLSQLMCVYIFASIM